MFRLVYNSRVLTEYVKGCPPQQQLCPIRTLFLPLSWVNTTSVTSPYLYANKVILLTSLSPQEALLIAATFQEASACPEAIPYLPLLFRPASAP